MKRYSKMTVCPEFHRKMKVMAAEQNKTIVQYTEELAGKIDNIKIKPKKQNGGYFDGLGF